MKHLGLLVSCATLSALATVLPAQTPAATTEPPAPPAGGDSLSLESSENATVNLVRLLVQRGVITQEDAIGLIRQAEREARVARTQAESVRVAAEQIRLAAAAEIAPAEDDVRVTYVPDHVRRQLAAEVRDEIMADTRAAAAESARAIALDKETSWITRIRPFADFRGRYTTTGFDEANDNTGTLPDFNSISRPIDLADLSTFYPTYNADADRQRAQLRARLGFAADLSEGYTFGLRLATGSGSNPVSTNQTSGDPGNFSKYSIWLDQAFLQWDSDSASDLTLRAMVGRMPNPFHKTELTWDDDLQLDGLALTGTYAASDAVSFFGAVGVFPVFNTSFNFPANQPSKFSSDDRFLTAAQIGIQTDITKSINFKAALAYYLYSDVEGAPSDPFVPLSANDSGSTDGRRPGFAQKGNTYMPLRDISSVAANGFGTTDQWQLYGLASEFTPLVATAQLDLNHFEPFQISLLAEAVQNTSYGTRRYAGDPRFDPIYFGGGNEGGDHGYLLGMSVGDAALLERWDWRAGIDYRFLQSDAILDAFADSDFGGGGTNLKGFTLSARLALAARVYLAMRWLSASEISGAPFRSDVFQFDINSKF